MTRNRNSFSTSAATVNSNAALEQVGRLRSTLEKINESLPFIGQVNGGQRTTNTSSEFRKSFCDLEKKLKRKNIRQNEVKRLTGDYYKLITELPEWERTLKNYKDLLRLFEEDLVNPEICKYNIRIRVWHEISKMYYFLNKLEIAVATRKRVLRMLLKTLKDVNDPFFFNNVKVFDIVPITLKNKTHFSSICDANFEHQFATKVLQILNSRQVSENTTNITSMLLVCGRLSLELKNYDQAFNEYKQAYNVINRLSELNEEQGANVRYTKILTLHQIGICSMKLNKLELAQKIFTKASKSFHMDHNTNEVTLPNNRNNSNLQGLQESVNFMKQSDYFMSNGLACNAKLQLGHLFYDKNEIEKAIKKYEEAFKPLSNTVDILEGNAAWQTYMIMEEIKGPDCDLAVDRLKFHYAGEFTNNLPKGVKVDVNISGANIKSNRFLAHDIFEIVMVMNKCKKTFFADLYMINAEVYLASRMDFEALKDLEKAYPDLDGCDRILVFPNIMALFNKFSLGAEALDFLKNSKQDFEGTKFQDLHSFELGIAQFKVGEFDDAIKTFEDTLEELKKKGFGFEEKSYNSYNCFYYIGKCYVELEQYENAVRYFDFDEYGERRHTSVALCYMKLKKYKEAQTELLKCHQLKSPYRYTILTNLISISLIMDIPYQDYLKKLAKQLCEFDSMKFLKVFKETLTFLPYASQNQILDLLLTETGRKEEIVALRQSIILKSMFCSK